MTSRGRVLSALRLEEPDRVPFCELGIFKGHAQVILNRKNSVSEKEIARLFHKDNISYWALPKIYYKRGHAEDGRLFMGDGLIKSKSDLKIIDLPDPKNENFYDSAKKFIDEKEDLAANAIVNLGFDPVVFCMGLKTMSYALYDDLSLLNKILDIYTDWQAQVIEKLIRIGFDFIWAADDLAYKTGPMIAPQMFRDVFLPKMRKVAEVMTVPWIYHSDGNIIPLLDDLLSLGMNGLHPIEPGAMDIFQMKKDYGDRICLIGNIDINTLGMGTKQEVEDEVKEKISKIGKGGGYIISSSNSIPDYVKTENVIAMAEAIQKYGKYPLKW